jgi:hypothetical protein
MNLESVAMASWHQGSAKTRSGDSSGEIRNHSDENT